MAFLWYCQTWFDVRLELGMEFVPPLYHRSYLMTKLCQDWVKLLSNSLKWWLVLETRTHEGLLGNCWLYALCAHSWLTMGWILKPSGLREQNLGNCRTIYPSTFHLPPFRLSYFPSLFLPRSVRWALLILENRRVRKKALSIFLAFYHGWGESHCACKSSLLYFPASSFLCQKLSRAALPFGAVGGWPFSW